MSDDRVRIANVEALHATANALLVRIDDEEYWIPQSQIHADSEVWKIGHTGTLVITRWFADKEGLESSE